MDDLKDILLENEKVLWSGAPKWELAERPKRGWRAKSDVFKFALTMLISFLVMMAWGVIFDPHGFASGILGVLIVFAAMAFAIAIMNVFGSNDPLQVRHDHLYAITDRRVIIRDRSKLTTRSLLGSILYEISTIRNGKTFDLNLSYNYPGDGYATFHALTDATEPERLLLSQFTLRKVE